MLVLAHYWCNNLPGVKIAVAMLTFVLALVLVQASANVIELNDSIVEWLDQGPWLINFYAPWCGYCRRLAPTYEKVGEYFANLDSSIKVARLDATTYLKVAQYFQVDGFPTIKFVDRDHSYTYTGDRKLHSLVSFALRANGPAAKPIDSASDFEANATRIKPDPFFVLLNNRDSLLKVSYAKLAEQYRLVTWFFVANSPAAIPSTYAHLVDEAQKPFRGVIVFKDGDGYVYPGLSDSAPANLLEQHLRDWILRERYPIFMEARVSDLWEIGATELTIQSQPSVDHTEASSDPGPSPPVFAHRLIALFLLSSSDVVDESSKRLKELGQALARKRVPELTRRYQFAWTDEQLDVLSNLAMVQLTAPSLVVVDPITRLIYLNPNQTKLNGLFSLEPDVVTSFLLAVADGRVTGYGGNTIPIRLRRMAHNFVTGLLDFIHNSPMIALLVFAVPTMFLGCVGYLCCCIDERYDDNEIEIEHYADKTELSAQRESTLTSETNAEPLRPRRRVTNSPNKRGAHEVTHLGPVISKEEIEARRAAYQESKKSH